MKHPPQNNQVELKLVNENMTGAAMTDSAVWEMRI
jgi:hypothetical protein